MSIRTSVTQYDGFYQEPIRQKALKCLGTDPDLINCHATRLRLITATLANRMNELITLFGEGHEMEKWLLKNLCELWQV